MTNDYQDSATAYESTVENAKQLQPQDTLDLHGVEDILDEGVVTRERWSPAEKFGNTALEMRRGETLEQRMAQEEPDVGTGPWYDDEVGGEVGDVRSGRLIMSDEAHHDDRFAIDAGIDGAGASAEEAAVHVIPDDEDDY